MSKYHKYISIWKCEGMAESDRRALAVVDLAASKFGTIPKNDLEKSIHIQKSNVSLLKEAIKSHK